MPKVAAALPPSDYHLVLGTSGVSFGRQLRLNKAHEFHQVFRSKCRSNNPCLTAIAIKNRLPHPRLGMVVSKKVERSAVKRNRIKRVIRESFRVNQGRLAGLDIVVVVYKGIGQKVAEDLSSILGKHWGSLQRCRK